MEDCRLEDEVPTGREDQGRRATRRAYASPQLVEFGSVNELTRGGTKSSGDGGNLRG